MPNEKLLKDLQLYLNEINKMLTISKLGLLKSEELSHARARIEDALKAYKPFLEQIQSLKIDKIIEPFRSIPKSGIFLDSAEVDKKLTPLRDLVQELVIEEGGSETVDPVSIPELVITGNTINRAIRDAKTLLENEGAMSAVDRMHTVLHGYLKQVCRDADILFNNDETINQLLNKLKRNHPDLVIKNENTVMILNHFSSVLDKVNTLRNNSTLAHANEILLEEDEAIFVINAINTVLSFLNSKFSK